MMRLKSIFENIPKSRSYFFSLIFIFLIFFALRLYKLGYHDFWYDEIGTISYAQGPWYNWNAPLYWIILHFWIKVFGISEFSLRLPSVIFSFLTVVFVFLLGKELFDKKTGLIASLLIGLSPFHLWYAQEARDYSMALFFGTSSSYLLCSLLKKGNLKITVLFIIISLAGLYTNYFYIFLFIAQVLYILFSKKLRFGIKELIPLLIIALGFSFYLPKMLSKFNFVQNGFWVQEPNYNSLAITLENFILGYNGFSFLYFILGLLMFIFFIALIYSIRKQELRQPTLFCVFLFFIPILLIFVFSKLLFSIYLDRGLIIFSPYFYLFLSSGIISCKKIIRPILFFIMIILILISIHRYFRDEIFAPLEHHIGTYVKKPIKPICRFLEENTRPKDIIAFTNDSTMLPVRYYSKKELPPFYYLFDPEFPDSSWQRPIEEGEYTVPFHKIKHLDFRRLWVICSDWARDEKLDENSESVKKWLDNNLKLGSSKEFYGLYIFQYER